MAEEEENAIEEQLLEQMAILRVRNAMSIENLISPKGEDIDSHEEYTDMDFLYMAEQGNDDDEVLDVDDEQPDQEIAARKLLPALNIVIRKLEENPTASATILPALRKLRQATWQEQQARNFFTQG